MKYNKVFIADFETTTTNTHYFKTHNDVRICLYYIKSLDGSRDNIGTNLDDFFKFLWKQNAKKLVVYFHNLNFDGDYILKYLDKHYKGFSVDAIDKKELYSGKWFTFLKQTKTIYSISVYNNNRKITFLCSLKLLSAGVSALGKAININKYLDTKEQEQEFYDVEPHDNLIHYNKNYIEYCKRDVEIVRISLNNFIGEINSINKMLGYKPFNFDVLTIGSLAYRYQGKMVKMKSMEQYKGLKISTDEHKLASNFFFGGFTQFNPFIQWKSANSYYGDEKDKNKIKIDINSAHPFSMTKLLPYGTIYNFKDKKPPKGAKILVYLDMKIGTAMTKYDNFLCLINWNKINKEKGWTSFRYVSYLSNFRCYYLENEFNILKEFYTFENVKIVNKYWCYADTFLKDYINYFYEYKKEYSKKGNKALANTYKILLNSSYGKHGTRPKFDELLLCDDFTYNEYLDSDIVITRGKFKKKFHFNARETTDSFKLKNTKILKLVRLDENEKNYNKLIAATITAYTRIYLFESILKAGVDNFLYCDTDSFILRDDKLARANLFLDDYEIGGWKIEYTLNDVEIRGAKKLRITKDDGKQEITFSGVHQRMKKELADTAFTDYETTIYKSNLRQVSHPSGVSLEWVDLKLKPTTH